MSAVCVILRWTILQMEIDAQRRLENKPTSYGLVTLLHICGVIPTPLPVRNFLFRIKRSSLTYLGGERPISDQSIVEETLTSVKYLSLFLISILNMYI